MSDAETIARLKVILKSVIEWYENILKDGEPDGSYLYDTTYEIFNDNLRRGDFQEIIELLLDPKPESPEPEFPTEPTHD